MNNLKVVYENEAATYRSPAQPTIAILTKFAIDTLNLNPTLQYQLKYQSVMGVKAITNDVYLSMILKNMPNKIILMSPIELQQLEEKKENYNLSVHTYDKLPTTPRLESEKDVQSISKIIDGILSKLDLKELCKALSKEELEQMRNFSKEEKAELVDSIITKCTQLHS